MTITVTNMRDSDIEVAINQWGDNGSTGYYTIHSGNKSGTWNRGSSRGFVMMVKDKDSITEIPYYVQHNSNVQVHEDKVMDGTHHLSNLNDCRR